MKIVDADVSIEKIKSLPIELDAETIQRCIEVLSNMPSAEPNTCEYWDSESNICALHRPSAEPEKEKAKRVLWIGWKGCRDIRYKCPNCKKSVKNDDIYCHRCGQRLMFPHVSFTDYVPGERQETIVRWDDE